MILLSPSLFLYHRPRAPIIQANLLPDVQGVCDDKKHAEGVRLGASFGANLSITGETEAGGTAQTFLNIPVFHSGAAWTSNPVCVGFGPLVGGEP